MTVTGSGSAWNDQGNLVVGGAAKGTLTIQGGGTLKTGASVSVGFLPSATGSVTVTGPGSVWNHTGGAFNIGEFGTGSLTIENGGTSTSNNNTLVQTNIGEGITSQGTVMVTGPDSTWTNNTSVVVGTLGKGTLTIQAGGTVNSIGGAAIGPIGTGTVTVTGPGSTWNIGGGLFSIGSAGTGTLTIADGGVVNSPGVSVTTGATGTGTLNIGASAGAPAAPGRLNAPSVAFGAGTGTLNFNHTSADYVFAPAISGNGTVNVLAGATTLTAANTYSGSTNVNAGTLRAGAVNAFSPNSPVTVAGAGTLDLSGFNQTVFGVTNAGLVNMGSGAAPATILTTTNYIGTGGTLAINTFLGGDGSPSDRLVINGGGATGNSFLHVTNVGGPGAETTGNGILVVETTNGATTDPGAFALSVPELRAGAFNYDLLPRRHRRQPQ